MEAEQAGAALARYYDLDLAGEQVDVALYLALAARTSGRILELAVGSGRISVPLAAAGHAVTGVDRDGHMLERARRAWDATRATAASGGSLELLQSELSGLALDQRYELVLLAFNSLLLLPGRVAQLQALQTMRRHLAPGGRAVVDVWLPAPDDLAIYDGRLVLDWLRADPESDERVAKVTSARFDAATATAWVTSFFDVWAAGSAGVRRLVREDELHLLSADELIGLAGQAGLAVESVAGDHSMNDFGPGSERIVLVCGLL